MSGGVAYDDVVFTGTVGPINLSGVSLGFWEPATAPPTWELYVRILFYPTHDNTVAPDAHPFSGTPVVWLLHADSSGTVTPLDQVTLDGSNVFTTPGDRSCGVYVELFRDAGFTQYAEDWGVMRRANFSAPVVGDSDPYGWFNNTGGPPTPQIITNSMRSGSATARRGTYMVLRGYLTYCSADFNNDGDSGADADIEAFFACLAGNCCATCGSADFNGDGIAGNDADIEAFFRVLAGGNC